MYVRVLWNGNKVENIYVLYVVCCSYTAAKPNLFNLLL